MIDHKDAEDKIENKTEEKAEGKTDSKTEELADAPEHTNEDRPHKRQRRSKNIRSKLEDLPESNDPEEMRNQVEFYFGDSNLPTDKFLLEKTEGHKNKPVSLETIHAFKRMRRFKDYKSLLEAVKASTTLSVTDDGEITRKTPLSDKFTMDVDENKKVVLDATMPRSVYIKGFGDEEEKTQTDIEDFMRPYGDFKAVRMRRVPYGISAGLFKGSVFVEFADEDALKAFLAIDPKPKYRDNDLEIMSKKDYVEMKNEEIKDGKTKANPPREARNKSDNWNDRRDRDNNNRGGSRGRGGNKRGGGDRRGDRNGRGGRGRGGKEGRFGGPRNRDPIDRDRDTGRNDKKRARDAQDGGNEGGEAKKVKAGEE